jgi:hypothetical protein
MLTPNLVNEVRLNGSRRGATAESGFNSVGGRFQFRKAFVWKACAESVGALESVDALAKALKKLLP